MNGRRLDVKQARPRADCPPPIGGRSGRGGRRFDAYSRGRDRGFRPRDYRGYSDRDRDRERDRRYDRFSRWSSDCKLVSFLTVAFLTNFCHFCVHQRGPSQYDWKYSILRPPEYDWKCAAFVHLKVTANLVTLCHLQFCTASNDEN